MNNHKTNYAYTAYVVRVKTPDSRRWEYFEGINLDDAIETTTDFSTAFRFRCHLTAEVFAKSLNALGIHTQIEEYRHE